MRQILQNIDQTEEDQVVEIIMTDKSLEKDMIQEDSAQEVIEDMDQEIINTTEAVADIVEVLVEKDGEKAKIQGQDLDPDLEIMLEK